MKIRGLPRKLPYEGPCAAFVWVAGDDSLTCRGEWGALEGQCCLQITSPHAARKVPCSQAV
jgi:hypothetical protein